MIRPLTVPHDTTLDAARAQFAALRRLSGAQRMELAARQSSGVRQMVEVGVRSRHPDYTEEQVRQAVCRLLLGEELFHTLYPHCGVRS